MNIPENIPTKQRAACVAVAESLAQAGGRALMVGGCVRDGLLGIPAKDVDIEVYGLDADAVEATLSQHYRLDTVGRAFGVFIVKGLDIDIALPRRESKTGPKHTDFVVEGDPNMSPLDAAARRDFTINAISFDPLTGELLDPYNGVTDLEARCLRHVSDAFSEDPLRVLRGMQFIARFDLVAAAETIALCRALTPEHLPMERLGEEWKKLILKGNQLGKGLHFLEDCGWLQYFPELEALVGCEQDPEWHPEGDVWKHTCHCLDAYAKQRIGDEWEDLVVGLAVVCHDMGKPATTYTDENGRIRSPRHDVLGVPVAKTFLERITRQKKLFEEVLPLVEQHMRPLALYRDGAGDSAIRRLAARVKRVDRLTRVAHADKNGRPPIECDGFPEGEWLLGKAAELEIKDNAPTPILLGRHLMECGIKPGPHFGKILDQAYEAQLDGVFTDLETGKVYLQSILPKSI
ncbi:MAG: HD domain-containing protein [Opitutales bacterium]|nr:HD domain-containing protein [Opitutales bacterium]MDP4882593.1 HD domain-containing protein [Opitutales bacterium]